MQNRQFPVNACIFNAETSKEMKTHTNSGNTFHAEISAINELNSINNHIEENKKYGIKVNLFPCSSCLEYIIKNRVSIIKYNHDNSKNQNIKTIQTILSSNTKILKIHSKESNDMFRNFFKK